MSKTETPVSQLKINRLTKTQFDSASDLSDTELYAVDPEFTGGKLLKTDSNGDIVESTATEEDATAGGTAIQGVQVNGSDLTPDTNKKVNVLVPTQASDVGAVASNASITGATKCKITYDSKGLVTSGADLSSSDVTTALGYTPYDSSNPAGYTSNIGTVTSVNNVQPVSGNVTLSIPTVNNATLTIQKNGTSVGTFTANASSNVTANITVPTDLGDLTNNAGYTKNVGTVTSVNNVSPVNGNVSLTIPTITIRRWS